MSDLDERLEADGDGASRDQFLIAMYREMWGNINRHILVVWQSVGLLAGTLTLFALVGSNAISLDFASTIIALTTAWLLAHLVDANYWYSRNLAIITNIERQFLTTTDLRHIHPYFKEHRAHSVLDHLAIQGYLALGIWITVMVYHFWRRVLPGIGAPWSAFDPARTSPYVASAIGLILLVQFLKKQRERHSKFLRDAPGLPVPPVN
jgi:hypothetical protein